MSQLNDIKYYRANSRTNPWAATLFMPCILLAPLSACTCNSNYSNATSCNGEIPNAIPAIPAPEPLPGMPTVTGTLTLAINYRADSVISETVAVVWLNDQPIGGIEYDNASGFRSCTFEATEYATVGENVLTWWIRYGTSESGGDQTAGRRLTTDPIAGAIQHECLESNDMTVLSERLIFSYQPS